MTQLSSVLINNPGAVADALASAVEARRGAFVAASVADLGLMPGDARAEVDMTVEHLRSKIPAEVRGVTKARRPLAGRGQEALMMLPSNTTVYSTAEIARAALIGNTVRARLTSRASTVSQLLQQVFDEVMPGVVRLEMTLSGPAFLDYALESDDVPFLMVWGGEVLGDAILERASTNTRKRIVFEGPGKDPAIVLAGADPEVVADELIAAKFAYSGQQCIAPENLLLHRSVHDAVVERLVRACTEARVGDPKEPNIQIGPMISAKVPDIVSAQLADAVQHGAEIVQGGQVQAPWVPPTVVTGITPAMKLFQDETFAPVFATCAFDDEDEAIALARDSRFGLRVAVLGDGAERVAAQLRGADYAEPVNDLVFGKYGMTVIGSVEGTDVPSAFGGYAKSGWILDDGQLRQGPKSTLLEATVPMADAPALPDGV